MNHWVAAFGGDGARRNHETTLRTGQFWVSSHRTPIRRVLAGDRVLLYLAGEGFAGEAVATAPCRTPYGETEWSGSSPAAGISLSGIRSFRVPVTCEFPQGRNAVLGLHRYALASGFASISEEGFRDVISWSETRASGRPADGRGAPEPPARIAEPPVPAAGPKTDESFRDARREKRSAGQHAGEVGRRRVALWTVAEIGASAFGIRGAEHFAREKAREAERTWLAGGRAEREVGAALDGLAERGFYLFHDVALPGIGNVDHVALGPHGFFAVETKSHAGRVAAQGGVLLLNGRPTEGDFVSQAWRGCYRLREILGAEVSPLLCFTRGFVEGRLLVRGVRVVPLRRLAEEILGRPVRNDSRRVATAVNALGAATSCYPSTVPRPRSRS